MPLEAKQAVRTNRVRTTRKSSPRERERGLMYQRLVAEQYFVTVSSSKDELSPRKRTWFVFHTVQWISHRAALSLWRMNGTESLKRPSASPRLTVSLDGFKISFKEVCFPDLFPLSRHFPSLTVWHTQQGSDTADEDNCFLIKILNGADYEGKILVVLKYPFV